MITIITVCPCHVYYDSTNFDWPRFCTAEALRTPITSWSCRKSATTRSCRRFRSTGRSLTSARSASTPSTSSPSCARLTWSSTSGPALTRELTKPHKKTEKCQNSFISVWREKKSYVSDEFLSPFVSSRLFFASLIVWLLSQVFPPLDFSSCREINRILSYFASGDLWLVTKLWSNIPTNAE